MPALRNPNEPVPDRGRVAPALRAVEQVTLFKNQPELVEAYGAALSTSVSGKGNNYTDTAFRKRTYDWTQFQNNVDLRATNATLGVTNGSAVGCPGIGDKIISHLRVKGMFSGKETGHILISTDSYEPNLSFLESLAARAKNRGRIPPLAVLTVTIAPPERLANCGSKFIRTGQRTQVLSIGMVVPKAIAENVMRIASDNAALKSMVSSLLEVNDEVLSPFAQGFIVPLAASSHPQAQEWSDVSPAVRSKILGEFPVAVETFNT